MTTDHTRAGAEACLICGESTPLVTVYEGLPEIVSGERFDIARCPRCSVMRTLPVPGDLTGYYESDLGQAMRGTPSRVHTALKQILLAVELKRIVSRIEPGLFLDVGAGAGDFAHLLHRRGFAVVAADRSPERPSMIRAIDAIPYHRIDYDRYAIDGFSGASRVTVIVRHVLEHLRNPVEFLRRMTQYGAAFFYVAVPNSACLSRRLLGRAWYLWDPPRHLWHFNRASLVALANRLGVEVLGWGYDTLPDLVPSLYRALRVAHAPPRVYNMVTPKGTLAALSAPLNALLPRNSLWLLAADGGARQGRNDGSAG